MKQDPTVNSIISPNDAVAKILGKEHPGRVRCMGLTVTPTSAFGNTSLRLRGLCESSSNSQPTNAQNEDRFVQLESQMENTLNAFKNYVLIKEGRIPDELASIFDSHPQSHEDGNQHESRTSHVRRSSSASNQDQ
ncbi:hypothetical protein CDL12_05985 [Handroanthus impetiginosus]|uniref:Uncharacterized protein n=1 Tax=Handroanthus impetiginosus TaxID=429701 RepID=A0A2G9HUX5_9LAMI|nr:hypothetical protein CDL12_05985 [Handroanthus impetiginosus]